MVQKGTFMSHWTNFWTYFQVFYLLTVMLALVICSIFFIFVHIDLNSSELYRKYVMDKLDEYDDEKT